MNWNEYKAWCKEVKEYLKTPKPLLRKENVIDADIGLIKDSDGREYQAQFNNSGTFRGLKLIKDKNE